MDSGDRERSRKEDDEDRRKRQLLRGRPSSSSTRNSLSSIPPPSDWLNQYNKLLDRYPLRTKMCTSFLVSAFGSALGSLLSANAKENKARLRKSKTDGRECKTTSESILAKINWVDVLSYAIHGGIINAPISHYWFEWLSVNGPTSNTASVLVDQLVVQPPLLVCTYFFEFLCRDSYAKHCVIEYSHILSFNHRHLTYICIYQ